MADTKQLNLYQKLLKITSEVGTIGKTGRNSQQGYGFIEHSEVMAVLRPQLEKWGVTIMPETVSRKIDRFDVTRSNGKQGTDIHVNVVSRYTVINADSPDERFVAEWDAGEAIDSGDKATNKATTASQKTYLMKLFHISDKEDADSESPEAAPASAQKPPIGRAQQGASLSPSELSEPINDLQGKMLLAKAREASDLEDWADIRAWFFEQFGTNVNDVRKAQLEQVSKVLTDMIGRGV